VEFWVGILADFEIRMAKKRSGGTDTGIGSDERIAFPRRNFSPMNTFRSKPLDISTKNMKNNTMRLSVAFLHVNSPRQADKQTSRQADKQTSRQADKQTSRQADYGAMHGFVNYLIA